MKNGTNISGKLTTNGSRIIDIAGNEVRFKGINWFGFNTGDNAPGGLDRCNLKGMMYEISRRGFDLLRIPVSCELLLSWMNGNYPHARFDPAINPELIGKTSLDVFDTVISISGSLGMRVMIDIHSAETDLNGHMYPLWYTSKIDEHQFKSALGWIAGRYKNNCAVVAYDIKNEPHGKAEEPLHAVWNDSDRADNWKRFAQEAAGTVLDNDPDALVVIEGVQVYPKDIAANDYSSADEADYINTWWGGNLMGVRNHPIDLGSQERNRQIVYSVHEYGPTVFMQPWFEKDYTYDSLYKDAWHDLWLYIVEEDIAPVFIGEWGGFMDEVTMKWLKESRRLISEYRLGFAVWCLNPESPDTGGLLKDDFKTWDEEKYSFIKELLDT
ncbi:MAG: glycoside hydrolase family 5 protein [Clostridiales bacterium]|nr:glycoside hydrolase family 5 protein [Clostridiales bacterium]